MKITLVEVIVIIAIIGTFLGLAIPVVQIAIDGPPAAKQEDRPAPRPGNMQTVTYDGHWWVRDGYSSCHHPDCPCYSRTPEMP